MDNINDFLNAMNNGKGFTWLSENGHKLRNRELVDIAKELVYAIEDAGLINIDRENIFRIATENLEDS